MGSTGDIFSKLIRTSLSRSTNQNRKLFSHCFPPLRFSLSYHLSLSVNQKKKRRKSQEFLDLLMKNVSPMSEMKSPWKLSQLNSPSSLLRTFKSLFGPISVFRRSSQVARVEKNPPANAGDVRDVGLIPGLGSSPGGGHKNPLHILAWRISMDRGDWQATVHRVTKNQTLLKWLSTHTRAVFPNHSVCGLPVFFYSQVMIRKGSKIEKRREAH